MLQWQGSIWQLPCGELCGGDDVVVTPVTPAPVVPFPTAAPVPLTAGTTYGERVFGLSFLPVIKWIS